MQTKNCLSYQPRYHLRYHQTMLLHVRKPHACLVCFHTHACNQVLCMEASNQALCMEASISLTGRLLRYV